MRWRVSVADADGASLEKFLVVCDPMLDMRGSVRPALVFALEAASRGFDVSLLSPAIAESVGEALRERGIEPFSLGIRLLSIGRGASVAWFEAWLRERLRAWPRRVDTRWRSIVNFSHIIMLPCLAWYVQGPPSDALIDMESELSPGYRLIYRFLRRLIEHADKSFIFAMRRYSSLVVANSKFCASLYERHGIGVDDVIYPPVELEVFKPTTSSPSSDYALAYFGKESKLSVIRMVADRGVRLKVFGFKAHPAKNALTHPNIECLWNISDSELADAYSNALFTIFTFTHEPFGYVPVESMACGTPVLTYGAQGPGEYVVGGRTGWIAHTDEELVEKAVELWRSGYPEGFRRRCVEFASGFDKHAYSKRLFKVLNCGLTHIGHV